MQSGLRHALLPAGDPRQLGNDLVLRIAEVVALMLCSGGTSVVRQDPQPRPDGQLRAAGVRPRADAHHPVLLIGARHDEIGIRDALEAAYLAVPVGAGIRGAVVVS